MKHEVRIIAGLYRGRRITFPNLTEIRPTPDRVKETLFNWLSTTIKGARCLDAFAGSGALGFEALSRGAEEVVMIESHKNIVEHLQKIQKMLQCNGLSIVHNDTYNALQHLTGSFDIIFLDPPFSNPHYEQIISIIQSRQLINPDGLLYVESPYHLKLDPAHWQSQKQKQAGDVYYSLWTLCQGP